MNKTVLLGVLCIFLLFSVVSAQVGYNNAGLPQISNSRLAVISPVNNNTFNVNASNCWQGYCDPNTYLPYAYNHTNVVNSQYQNSFNNNLSNANLANRSLVDCSNVTGNALCRTGRSTYASVNTTNITTTGTSLELRQLGDAFGSTSLTLMSRTGAAGALFKSYGLQLVDFAFQTNTVGAINQSNLRYEQRSAFTLPANPNGEFQLIENFGPPFLTWFKCGTGMCNLNSQVTNITGNLTIHGTKIDISRGNGILNASGFNATFASQLTYPSRDFNIRYFNNDSRPLHVTWTVSAATADTGNYPDCGIAAMESTNIQAGQFTSLVDISRSLSYDQVTLLVPAFTTWTYNTSTVWTTGDGSGCVFQKAVNAEWYE